MSEKSCSTFYCDLRGGRYCCAFCPDPCKNRCLNHPDRCKLANDRTPFIQKRSGPEVEACRKEIARLIEEGNLTGKEIAKRVGVSAAIVTRHKRRLKEQKERERES